MKRSQPPFCLPLGQNHPLRRRDALRAGSAACRLSLVASQGAVAQATGSTADAAEENREVAKPAFRPLLDGTTNWPAVMDALEAVDYDGFVTFEYFHPYPHYPEALVYQTSDSLDRILGRFEA